MLNLRAMASSLHSGAYRPDIDGLRCIAVMAVVICHGFPAFLPGGFIGVDIFFVLSGYLITQILIRDIAMDRFSIVTFYQRRIRRIFPALIAVLLFVLAVGWMALFRPEFSQIGLHVIGSSLFFENFLLWSESGYFDVSSATKPLLHIWSLAIEEQFYIFWPLLMLLSRRGHIGFGWMFAILATLSFGTNLYDLHVHPVAAYYSPLGRFWELMVGAFLARIHVDRPELFDRHHNAQAIVGVAMLAAALVLLNETSMFPGFWALLPTLGTALLISAGEKSWINRVILASPPFVWVGLISYPLYLWHWPLMSLCTILTGALTPMRAGLAIALAIVAATGTFLFIERPFRKGGAAGATRRVVVLCAAMGCVLALAGLVATQMLAPRLKGFNAPTRHEWRYLMDTYHNYDPNNVGIYRLHPDRSRQVYFLGDSHLAQYAEHLDALIGAQPQLPGAVMAMGGGCNMIPGTRTDASLPRDCWALRDQAWALAVQPQYDTVVIGGAWSWYFLTGDYYLMDGSRRIPMPSPEGRKLGYARLAQQIAMLRQRGKRVILVLDDPQSPALSPFSLQARSTRRPNFQPDRFVKIAADQIALNHEMLDFARKLQVDVIDPYPFLCHADLCRATTETGLPIYKDVGHFNPDWAREHASFIDPVLAKSTRGPAGG